MWHIWLYFTWNLIFIIIHIARVHFITTFPTCYMFKYVLKENDSKLKCPVQIKDLLSFLGWILFVLMVSRWLAQQRSRLSSSQMKLVRNQRHFLYNFILSKVVIHVFTINSKRYHCEKGNVFMEDECLWTSQYFWRHVPLKKNLGKGV